MRFAGEHWLHTEIESLDFVYSKTEEIQLDFYGNPLLLILYKTPLPNDITYHNVECIFIDYTKQTANSGPFRVENIIPTTKWCFSLHGTFLLVSEKEATYFNDKGKVSVCNLLTLQIASLITSSVPCVAAEKLSNTEFLLQDATGCLMLLTSTPSSLKCQAIETKDVKGNSILFPPSTRMLYLGFRDQLMLWNDISSTCLTQLIRNKKAITVQEKVCIKSKFDLMECRRPTW